MYIKSDFSGDLKFMSLSDILQVLGGNSSEGVLYLTSDSQEHRGVIYFSDGNPIDASNGVISGLDAIYSLFGWDEGAFEFHKKSIHRRRAVNKNRMEIIMDAMRMIDEENSSGKDLLPVNGHQSGKAGFGDESERRVPVLKGPLVDYSYVVKESSFSDGDVIIKESSYGNWIWVILDGTVEVIRETVKEPVNIVCLGEGSFLGTFTSLLFTEFPRSATIRARGEVHLGLLDILRLSGDYASLSPGFRELLMSLANRLKNLTDKTADLFLYGTGSQELLSMENSTSMFRQDFEAEDLFVIRKGEVNLFGNKELGNRHFGKLGVNDVFGCIPFLQTGQEPHNAVVMGSEDLAVSRIDTDMLQKEYGRLSGTFRNLIENVGDCVSATTRRLCE